MLVLSNFGGFIVVPKKIKLSQLGGELRKSLEKTKQNTLVAANKATRKTAIKSWSLIITETPVDKGRARNNWFIDTKVSDKTTTATTAKGASYIASKIPTWVMNAKVFLYNNLPYISTLEYGGYPNPSETGDKTKNGFSKLAPKGMVRKNIKNFNKKVEKEFIKFMAAI